MKSIMRFPVRGIVVILLYVLLPACSSGGHITTTATPEQVQEAVQQDQWTFMPQQVIPQYGRSRSITSPYQVRLFSDSLEVYLPYYGRSYTAVIGSEKGPLDFTTTAFRLEHQETTKDRATLVVIPEDQQEVQRITFNIFFNGHASASVQLTNRSAISFEGYVQPGGKKE